LFLNLLYRTRQKKTNTSSKNIGTTEYWIFLEWQIYRINYDNVFLFSKITTSILYARRVVLPWLNRETSINNNVSISLRPTRQGKNGWLFSWMCKHVPMYITRCFKYFKIDIILTLRRYVLYIYIYICIICPRKYWRLYTQVYTSIYTMYNKFTLIKQALTVLLISIFS